jgi:hypothetical protein
LELLITCSLGIIGSISFLLFFEHFKNLGVWFAGLFKKKLDIPSINTIDLIPTLPSFFLHWFSWGTGFMLLSEAVFSTSEVYLIFSFPLATVVGIVALISPGGIGIRESAIVGCLALTQFDIEQATTLAVFSRVWFLCGDFLTFLISFFIKQNYLPQNENQSKI